MAQRKPAQRGCRPARAVPLSKALLGALFASLALRWGASLLTQFKPVFPDYYYADAKLYDRASRELLAGWKADSEERPVVQHSHALYTLSSAALYGLFGAKPLGPKLVNGLLATAAVFFWYRTAALLMPAGAAVLLAWMLALWPTNIFNSSQHFRDAQILLFSSLTVYFFLRGWTQTPPADESEGRRQVWLALGALALALTGLHRPYLMALMAASLFAGGALSAFSARRAKRPIVVFLASGVWIFAALALCRPLSSAVAVQVVGRTAVAIHEFTPGPLSSLPTTGSSEKNFFWLTAEVLSERRHARHAFDQYYARSVMNRDIGSQIFPDAAFHSWWDVIAFLPKGTFYATLMPLPGLYPVQGKIGRIVASMENLVLLICLVLALAGWRRAKGLFPLFSILTLFFCLTALFYGLFELDLGSASRHRLQYFPCVLMPAALTLWHALPPGLRGLIEKK